MARKLFRLFYLSTRIILMKVQKTIRIWQCLLARAYPTTYSLAVKRTRSTMQNYAIIAPVSIPIHTNVILLPTQAGFMAISMKIDIIIFGLAKLFRSQTDHFPKSSEKYSFSLNNAT